MVFHLRLFVDSHEFGMCVVSYVACQLHLTKFVIFRGQFVDIFLKGIHLSAKK